jgi:hypothetical protein
MKMNKYFTNKLRRWTRVHIIRAEHGNFVKAFCGVLSWRDEGTIFIEWAGIHNYKLCKHCIYRKGKLSEVG